MTLTGQVGQLLMVGVPSSSPSQAAGLIRSERVGGVFLHGRTTTSATGLASRLASLQRLARRTSGVGVDIGVDQEGGQVRLLRGPGFVQLPSASVQGTWTAAELAARTAASARSLRAGGITMNLAPVADVVPAGTAADNPPIGRLQRQYGSTPGAVAADVGVVVRASRSAGVQTAAKHFPGLGRVRVNTDFSAGAVDTRTTASDPALGPFGAAISAGTDAVMISLASYPGLDPDNIAAFSPSIVTGLLRERMGYGGVVMSDDLGAAKAVTAVPAGRRAVRFVAAGGDIVLTVDPSTARAMQQGLLAEATRSLSFRTTVARAVERVLLGKAHAGLLRCSAG